MPFSLILTVSGNSDMNFFIMVVPPNLAFASFSIRARSFPLEKNQCGSNGVLRCSLVFWMRLFKNYKICAYPRKLPLIQETYLTNLVKKPGSK